MRIQSLAALLALALTGHAGAPAPPAPGVDPICDPGPPQVVECTGPRTPVQLDGTGSVDPLGGTLSYRWELCDDPRVTIDDELSPTPVLTVDMQGTCLFVCDVYLIVKNAAGQSVCATTVTVRDTTPPVLTCPLDWAVPPGGSIDPAETGMATAWDACNPSPTVTYVDKVIPNERILRRWIADDGCRKSTCVQTLLFVGEGYAHFDVLPGACPNGLDVSGFLGGTLNGGILGNATDVTSTDLTSITLSVGDNDSAEAPTVAPLSATFGDVGAPFTPLDPCACAATLPDGTTDIDLVFDKAEVINTFGLANLPDGTVVPLKIRGKYLDGSVFEGFDCVVISKP